MHRCFATASNAKNPHSYNITAVKQIFMPPRLSDYQVGKVIAPG
jgi:hypothetical protein